MYHVCLHLLSDDISILIGCRCTPLQGDWRPCMYSHRSVCLHLPSDDIHLYVYAPLRQGLATVCFYWRESIYLRSVCLHLHVPQMTKCRHVFLTCTQRQARQLKDM